jgi:Spy/CpxP family protein refolding chaperone
MRSKIIVMLGVLFLAATTIARADTPNNDPIGAAMIPPEIVMGHQQELGLTDAQKTAIQGDVQQAQSRFTGLQWQLSAAVERLATILKQPHVNENDALAQLDREQSLERDIKRTQIQLMIRIKNELTPDQQTKAFALKHGG